MIAPALRVTIHELAAARGAEHEARLVEHFELLMERVGARARHDLCERCRGLRDTAVCVNCELAICADCAGEETCTNSFSREHACFPEARS